MKVKLKICGIKTENIAQYAVGHGVEYIGVIFFPKSPRHVSYSQAAKIHKSISGNANLISVMVNPSDSEIAEMLTYFKPEYIQLHGSETIERVKGIKSKFSIPLIKAISVSSKKDIKKAKLYIDDVEFILFDAKPPKNSNLPGGNAVSFDWSLLDNLDLDKKFFLSGGINIKNVDEALNISKAKYIDLSSSVESASGVKSKKLIKLLIEKVNKR